MNAKRPRPSPRLHVNAHLSEGARVRLGQDASHYVLHVMRIAPGGEARLFNGRDGEWAASLTGAHKNGAELTVQRLVRAQQAVPDLELMFAPVRRTRTEFIVEKACELGAARIRPVITRRTQAERVRRDRLEAIIREAAEQCERLCLPRLDEPAPLQELLDGWDERRRILFADEAGAAPNTPWFAGETGQAASAALQDAASGPWAILIGPEGGFAPEERARLLSMACVTPITLGPRILRADTAALAALTLWQAALGDWRGGWRDGA